MAAQPLDGRKDQHEGRNARQRGGPLGQKQTIDQTGNTPKQGQPARQGQDRDRGHPAIELDLDQKGFADPPGTDEEIGQTKEPAAPKSAPQSMGRARILINQVKR